MIWSTAAAVRELQNEVIDLEDLSSGISITDLTLNDFRMDLAGIPGETPTNSKLCPLAPMP